MFDSHYDTRFTRYITRISLMKMLRKIE